MQLSTGNYGDVWNWNSLADVLPSDLGGTTSPGIDWGAPNPAATGLIAGAAGLGIGGGGPITTGPGTMPATPGVATGTGAFLAPIMVGGMPYAIPGYKLEYSPSGQLIQVKDPGVQVQPTDVNLERDKFTYQQQKDKQYLDYLKSQQNRAGGVDPMRNAAINAEMQATQQRIMQQQQAFELERSKWAAQLGSNPSMIGQALSLLGATPQQQQLIQGGQGSVPLNQSLAGLPVVQGWRDAAGTGDTVAMAGGGPMPFVQGRNIPTEFVNNNGPLGRGVVSGLANYSGQNTDQFWSDYQNAQPRGGGQSLTARFV